MMSFRRLLCVSNRRHAIGGIFLIVLTIATVSSAQDAGLLRMTVLMPDTDEFARNNTTGHRSYVELDSLLFTVMATNESSAPVMINQGVFRDAFSAGVGAEFEMPVSLRWVAIQGFEANTPSPIGGSEPVLIKPQEFVVWTVAIARQDGFPFSWGDYVVSLSVGNLRPAVSTPDGGTWGGRLMEGGTYRRLVSVKAPTTPVETARRWAIVSGTAQKGRDYEAALQAMLQAVAADSSYRDNLALLFLASERYKEAAAEYERITGREGLGDTLATQFLAQAYVGLGEEAKAIGVLLKGGLPQERIGDEVASMRKRINDRALERR